MEIESGSKDTEDPGATAVITHRVCEEHQAAYEQWLDEIAPKCKAYPGHLDWSIIRPIPGITSTFTVVIRFDTKAHLQAWMDSGDRQRLIDQVQPLLLEGDDFYISSGLDFWFTPSGARAQLPTRWKQFLATWSVIYPLVLGMPLLILPALRAAGSPENRLLDTFVLTGSIVFLMVYVIMPRYTKLIRHWLFD
ncbi:MULTISPECIES: antibiotic biosynthesis monooxygenase [Microbulbifer]|uniref:antibiotic biosynthesis monooxygenase n=1 Tax=Microbulbifer TaxID=48073 RepID=UPI001E631B3A|nr:MULTISPECIES: antibiotic biosynthesis monooxygenase [Microbulbifer]UHQ55916.1 antibiotic biosynthesis monooxygenase [Microbulbifer sp. YPW16]